MSAALVGRDGSGDRASRRRHLVGYAAILLSGAGVLAVVLPVGGRIDAPTVPGYIAVSGRSVDCLGTDLAARQSGVFLDLHVAQPGGTAENPVAGDRIGHGRIDRSTGRVELSGTCRPGRELAGRRFEADVDVTTLEDRTVDATVVVGDLHLPGGLGPSPPARDTTGREPLQGTDLTGRMLLATAVVILLARAVGSLFRPLKQPRVIGEIVAGIALGPSVVGALAPGVTDFLFPPEVVQMVGALAQLGVIFFMFLVGLELDLGSLRGSGRTAVLVSHVSIVAPSALGVVAALVLFPLLGDGDFTSFALFMGAAMSITAFPVLARILSDTGLQRTKLGAIAITCAAVDDVTAWCVLSVVVATAQASGPDDVVRTAGFALLYVLVMYRLVRPALAWWLARRASAAARGTNAEAPANQTIALLLALLLFGAWFTESIGIHAIFGAFLVGVVIPREAGGVVDVLTVRLQDVTRLVLLPLFFVVAGLSTRVGLLDSPLLWGVTSGVFALAVLGKWVGSTLAAVACRMPLRDAAALGVLMNARGLTEIVILTIGLELGIMSPALFTAMVLMALATTVMTVPVLSWLGVVPAVTVDDTARAEGRAGVVPADDVAVLPLLSSG